MPPFSPYDPTAITAEIDAVSRWDDSGSFVPFGLRQSDSVITTCITGTQRLSVDVIDTFNAVKTCHSNVECDERELVQPRPRADGLVFHAGGLPQHPLSPSLFPSGCPPPSLSSRCVSRFLPWFFRRIGCSTPTTRRSFPCYFCLLACNLGAFLPSSLQIPRFPRWRCPDVSHGYRGKRFRIVGMHHH